MNLCFVLFSGSFFTVKRRYPLICSVPAFFKLHEIVFEKDAKKALDDNFKVKINWTFYFYICRCSFFIVFTSHVDVNCKAFFRAFEAKFLFTKSMKAVYNFVLACTSQGFHLAFAITLIRRVHLKKTVAFTIKKRTFRDFTEGAYNLSRVLVKDGKFRQLFKCW